LHRPQREVKQINPKVIDGGYCFYGRINRLQVFLLESHKPGPTFAHGLPFLKTAASKKNLPTMPAEAV
jgi:hypothetical protein